MDLWIRIGVLVAFIALPVAFIWGKRAFDRSAGAALERVYRDAERELQTARETDPVVSFRYHTYSGILVYVDTVEHAMSLPYPVAEKTLEALFQYSLRYGFFAYGAALIPTFAYLNYRKQRRRIRKQRSEPRRTVARISLESAGDGAVAGRRSAAERWGIAFILLVLSAGACSGGLTEWEESRANPEIRPVDCAVLAEERPDAQWVRVSGAVADLGVAALRTENGVAQRVYVPLACAGAQPERLRMLLASEDPELLAQVQARSTARVARDFEGMVRDSNHRDLAADTSRLEGRCAQCPVQIDGLVPGYVVLVEGTSPSLLRAAAWLAAAVVGVGLTAKLLAS